MIPELSSSSTLCGDSGECQKLLPVNGDISQHSTPMHKDGSRAPHWESLAFLGLLLLGAVYHEMFCFGQPPEEIHGIPRCKIPPCFEPSHIHVPMSIPSFPSFLDYAHRGPLRVSYDERSLKLNGERSFFIGGSMHPARATSRTWNYALDEAVENGLNLITIYVMWSDHQPLPDKAIDWTFPDWSLPLDAACHDTAGDQSCKDWNLATAIRSAANRGLFVHLRIGPYDCAEYSYGGLPEWLPLQKPNMELRRPNGEWLEGTNRINRLCRRHITVLSGFSRNLLFLVHRQ